MGIKKIIAAVSVLALVFIFAACTPDKNSVSSSSVLDNPDVLIETGEAMQITEFTVVLTGYVNLPSELDEAEVGVVYDNKQSFEEGKKVAVDRWLDGYVGFAAKVTGLLPGTSYYYKAYIQYGKEVKYGEVSSFSTKESNCPAGAVDLGIVMTREDGTTYKLYWAKSNLCEEGLCPNPEDYGDYYSWGETEIKDDYGLWTYKWCNNSYSNLTKYNNSSSYGTVDNKTVLDPEDDVAHIILGGKWRIPTDVEWAELRKSCSWTGVFDQELGPSGVNGMLVKSINGNSIFLSDAGRRSGSGLQEHAGLNGYYWTSTLNTAKPERALYIDILFNSVAMKNDFRHLGFSVRPVSE